MTTKVSSLYIHVPFCRHLCNYCDFFKKRFDRPNEQLDEFESFLTKSHFVHSELLQENRAEMLPLQTLYLGGGTPSLWGPRGGEFLSQMPYSLSQDCEATLEIDPGAWSEEGLGSFKKFGINRFSIGTQSLDSQYLKILDRAHSKEETFSLLERLQGENFSVDFLIGVPVISGQKRDIFSELEELLKWGPSHVSLYILQPAAGYILKSKIAGDELIAQEYLGVSHYLRSQGFEHYEVSNFARKGFQSKHNKNYWQMTSVAALGPSASGFLHLGERAVRYKWRTSSAVFERELLGPSELALERLYLSLRAQTPWSAQELWRDAPFLSKWGEAGYLNSHEAGKWTLTPEAWVVLDGLVESTLRYLD